MVVHSDQGPDIPVMVFEGRHSSLEENHDRVRVTAPSVKLKVIG